MPQLFAHRDTQACTHTGAHTLFERGNSADDAWVFVMDEGTSICWSTSWCFSLFRQAKKLQHKMHYLAPVCQPSCLYLIFSCLGLSPGLSLCVCVCVSAWRGRPGGLWGVHDDTGAQTAVVRQQGRIPGQHHRQHLLAGERQSFLVTAVVCFSSLTILILYQFHLLRLLLFTLTVFQLSEQVLHP